MKELTKEIVYDFLNMFFYGEVDGIWAEDNCKSFCFDSKNLQPNMEEMEGTLCDIKYRVSIGTTKLCIFLEDYDKVIKLPLSGIYCDYTYEYNEENTYDAMTGLEEPHFEICEELYQNFIEEEIDLYNSLSDSAKRLLLPNIYIGNIYGIRIYLQEKVNAIYADVICDCNYHKTFDINVIKSRKMDYGYVFPRQFRIDIVDNYSDSENMLRELDTKVSDMHNYNIGYTAEKIPVCFDYASSESGSF